MNRLLSWEWVETEVMHAADSWSRSAGHWPSSGSRYGPREQHKREKAYDRALRDAERESKRTARWFRGNPENRLIASFARFAATALDLDCTAIGLLTDDFLPAGRQLAQWARQFDPSLSSADILQACRNAWTACGLQPLLGAPIRLTPAIMGYSLLYPYTDNYLDELLVSREDKLCFGGRFRHRLRGDAVPPLNRREASIWEMVGLIEQQYPRVRYPQVFDALLAIHRAQQESIPQLQACGSLADEEILRISCAKGGASVLADACLVHGALSEAESRFAFEWGVLLQLGDDLQDVEEDLQRGSGTLFTLAIQRGELLDGLVTQLLNFSERVSGRMDALPQGSRTLKSLLRMSWRSLILMAVAQTHQFFSPELLANLEHSSPFRFGFLRARRERLKGKTGLFERLFEIVLNGDLQAGIDLPLPVLHLPAPLPHAAPAPLVS